MRRKEMLFGVIGGVVGAVLVMAVGLIAPLGAQKAAVDLNVGEITCSGLRVVDRAGVTRVYITPNENEYGGAVVVHGDGRRYPGRSFRCFDMFGSVYPIGAN